MYSATSTNHNAFASNGHNAFAEPHQYEDGLDEQGDKFEDEAGANVPLYDGELCPEWRYTCSCCFSPSGLTTTYRQSLSTFVMYLIDDHAEGEILDLISRVLLAQYPPLRYGPSKPNKSTSHISSVQGGSVYSGSMQGSRQGSVQASLRGASARGAPAMTKGNLANLVLYNLYESKNVTVE